MINLHLFIPSLFWHNTSLPEIYQELSTSNLETILAKSTMKTEIPQKYEEWLCKTFNITKQQNWPIAPITLNAEILNKVAINLHWNNCKQSALT